MSSGDIGAATVPATPLMFTTGNWNMAQTVTVRGIEDADASDETVRVTHAATSTDPDYDDVGVSAVIVTVTDDEMGNAGVTVSQAMLTVDEGGTASYTLVLNSPPRTDVSIGVTSNNTNVVTATALLRFTQTDWDTAQTVTVRGVEDADAITQHSLRLSHTVRSIDVAYNSLAVDPVGVTVRDNDMVGVTVTPTALMIREGVMATYTLVLNSQPRFSVAIEVISDDAGAASGTSFLRFTRANWNRPQTVTVRTQQDNDLRDETVRLSHRSTSLDTPYNSIITEGVRIADVTVTVMDDDAPGVAGVTVTPTTLMVAEGGMGTYAVVLTAQPSSGVRIAVASDNVAAVVNPASLPFARDDWNTPQMVTVMGVEDGNARSETVNVTHAVTSTDTAYAVITPAPVVVSVTDNDTVGVSVTPTALTVGEGSTGSYTLVLDTPPTHAVTVMVTSDDMGAATVSPTSLTFTTDDFNMLKTVMVTGIRDADTNSERVRLTHTVSSSDTRYATVTPDAVVVTVSEVDLDVDGSGGDANQSDGLMIGRYLFGIRDNVGLLDTIPGSPSFDAVTANIARAVASGRLDVDGSGGAANQSDGLMIGRYLFGIRDAAGLLDTIPGNPSFSAVTANIGALE